MQTHLWIDTDDETTEIVLNLPGVPRVGEAVAIADQAYQVVGVTWKILEHMGWHECEVHVYLDLPSL